MARKQTKSSEEAQSGGISVAGNDEQLSELHETLVQNQRGESAVLLGACAGPNADTQILPAVDSPADEIATPAEGVMVEVPVADSDHYPMRRFTRDLNLGQANLVQRIAAGLRRDGITLSSGKEAASPDEVFQWFLEQVAKGEARR